MRWLLDTNAWIDLLKPGNFGLVSRLAQCTDDEVVLCSIVKAELWHGANRYTNREDRLNRLQLIFDRHRSFSFDDAAAWHYADIRSFLEAGGRVIGPNDLKIAAICRTHQLILVTSNTGEFSRVPDLQVENWR